jgi:alpha-beta hydrolase superfamily lysophospholipase
VTTFVLVPGAGGQSWYWHRLVPELERRGHRASAVDLPADDETAGLAAYTAAVVAAIADRGAVTLVAQSMGGLTAPLVCERVPVERLVLVNAMIPLPGETGGDWWAATGQGPAQAAHWAELGLAGEPDDDDAFFHDVPDDVAAAAKDQPFAQSARPFADPWR